MFSLNCNGKLLLIEKPLVMGILNLTDDSFYAGSRLQDTTAIQNKAIKMMEEGVDILDIGAQSTRPGSKRLSAEEELKKLLPVIALLKSLYPEIIISIDTYHTEVARQTVSAGAAIINDISAGSMDKKMIPLIGKLGVPYICMHMRGVPETMQNDTGYENITKEIVDFFIKKIEECKQAGIKDIIVDPGFGFGKHVSQNFLLLKNLSIFKILNKPIMVGVSRKSTVYKTLKIPVEDSLNGTTALHSLALLNGASLLRVHDVKEAKEVVALLQAYSKA